MNDFPQNNQEPSLERNPAGSFGGLARTVTILSLLLVVLFPAGAFADTGWKQADLDGIPIAYRDIGGKDAPALVFIHGWSCDSSFWRMQVPDFKDTYRLILIDLPGFGRSGKPQGVRYTMSFFARAVKAVVDDAQPKNPVLIGHSMGFAVARQFLIDYPGNAGAVCSVDGAAFVIPEGPEALAAWKREIATFQEGFSGPDRAARVEAFIEDTFYRKTAPELRAEIKAKMLSANEWAANSAIREMCEPDQWKARAFDIPALAVYAVHPDYPMDNAADLRRSFPEKLTYIEWDDLGHYIMLEAPARFNKVLSAFLESLRTS